MDSKAGVGGGNRVTGSWCKYTCARGSRKRPRLVNWYFPYRFEWWFSSYSFPCLLNHLFGVIYDYECQCRSYEKVRRAPCPPWCRPITDICLTSLTATAWLTHPQDRLKASSLQRVTRRWHHWHHSLCPRRRSRRRLGRSRVLRNRSPAPARRSPRRSRPNLP